MSTPAAAPGSERRATLLRALAALAVIAGALFFALSSPVRLGLDLRGGTQIVLETRDTGTVVADAESTDRVVEVLRKRVDALGVSEPTLARSGDTPDHRRAARACRTRARRPRRSAAPRS